MRHSGRELFRSNSQQLWSVQVWRQGHATAVDTFLQELEVPSGGVVAIGWRCLCLGFRLSPRTRDGLPQAPAVAVVRVVHDSATALSKNASDEHLWKTQITYIYIYI